MAVNNPATNDFRVVKSAEMVAKAGYDCHVVGVLKPGYKQEEIVNGVNYHRVKLRLGFYALVAGIAPNIFLFLLRFKGRTNNLQILEVVNSGAYKLRSVSQENIALRFFIILFFIPAFVASLLVQIILYSLILYAIPFFFVISFVIVFMRVIKGVFREHLKASNVFRFAVNEIILANKWILEIANKWILKTSSKVLIFRNKAFSFGSKVVRKVESVVGSYLRPECSPHGVRYLQGRYLSSYFNKLMALEGDVYHAHELWMLESCSIVANRLGSNLVYDSHELELHRNNNWSPKSNAVRRGYEKKYIKRVDGVLAVSSGCAQEIAKVYGFEDIPLLRNTPLLSGLVETDENLRNELDIGLEVRLMIYTGSVTINRGVELILKALNELPNYVLVTIGPWNESIKNELEFLAAELAVKNRFHMHPKVSPKELISLVSQGDVAVIPIMDACLSYRYCLPNKLFEAAFAGLPIVASNLPDMAEFITENELGMVFETGSVSSLVTAIKSLEEFGIREKLKRNLEDIRRENCFEKESRVLINMYQSFFDQHQSSTIAKRS